MAGVEVPSATVIYSLVTTLPMAEGSRCSGVDAGFMPLPTCELFQLKLAKGASGAHSHIRCTQGFPHKSHNCSPPHRC